MSLRSRIGALLVCTIAVAAGCSNEPAAEKSPQQATDELTKVLFLSPDQASCVRTVLEADPSLAAALNTTQGKLVSQGKLDDFTAKTRSCLTTDVLVGVYLKITPEAVATSDDQRRCIETTIRSMDQPTRDELLLLAIGTASADPLSLSKAVSRITQACNLTTPLDGPPGGGTTGTPPTATLPPGGGATVVSRP